MTVGVMHLIIILNNSPVNSPPIVLFLVTFFADPKRGKYHSRDSVLRPGGPINFRAGTGLRIR